MGMHFRLRVEWCRRVCDAVRIAHLRLASRRIENGPPPRAFQPFLGAAGGVGVTIFLHLLNERSAQRLVDDVLPGSALLAGNR